MYATAYNTGVAPFFAMQSLAQKLIKVRDALEAWAKKIKGGRRLTEEDLDRLCSEIHEYVDSIQDAITAMQLGEYD